MQALLMLSMAAAAVVWRRRVLTQGVREEMVELSALDGRVAAAAGGRAAHVTDTG